MEKGKKSLICKEEIRTAARILRAVNHSLRRDILYLLERNTKVTVTDIYETLGIEQSVCSQQLSILRKEGIVGVERAAKNRYYYIVRSRLMEINNCAEALAAASKQSSI